MLVAVIAIAGGMWYLIRAKAMSANYAKQYKDWEWLYRKLPFQSPTRPPWFFRFFGVVGLLMGLGFLALLWSK